MFDSNDKLVKKWAPVLEHADLPAIEDAHKAAVTARLLENSEVEFGKNADQASFGEISETTNVSGGVDKFDPVLISMVRRTMPNLIAYDIAGVQPMTGPTGLIFAMHSKYTSQAGTEALFNEADSAFAADGTAGALGLSQGSDPTGLEAEAAADVAANDGSTVTGGGDLLDGIMGTAEGEQLGVGADQFQEMAFTITETSVTAKTRALKAEYTMELAQDLRAIHGLDAETELSNILSTEALAEINREVVRTIYKQAVIGAANTTNPGVMDLSATADTADARWQAERYKALAVQIGREANAIAKATRRGRGNFVIVSADVATALNAAGALDYAPAMQVSLSVDSTGNTFAGTIGGSIKVYIDPYAAGDFACVGYRGSNPYDAGIFYCPYVPLTKVKAVGENTFQPKIGFKTRYGMVANPYVDQTSAGRNNTYFRIFRIDSL